MNRASITKRGFARQGVIMAGLGGRGVLMAGELLMEVAAQEYEHITYFPTYGAAVRGGDVECTVIFSDEPIGSSVVPQADVVVIFDNSKLQSFEGRVRPGGLMILESTGLKEETSRSDIKVLKVPAVEMATTMGNIRAANMILFGAYVEATKAVLPELVEKQLEQRMMARKEEELLSTNKAAFRQGIEVAKQGGVKLG